MDGTWAKAVIEGSNGHHRRQHQLNNEASHALGACVQRAVKDPKCLRRIPKIRFFLRLGIKTTWYLQSHLV